MIQFDKHVIHLGVLTTSLVKCWLVLREFSSRTKEGLASTSRHRCDLRCTFIGGKVHRMGFQGEIGERYALMLGRDLGNLSFFDYKKQMVKG